MINKASNSTLSTIKPDISGKKFNFMNLLCPICYVFDCPMHKSNCIFLLMLFNCKTFHSFQNMKVFRLPSRHFQTKTNHL